MNPSSATPFRIGPAAPLGTVNVLVAATQYPSVNGSKPGLLLPSLDPDGPNAITALQGGDQATFGTATLQRQFSYDGINWINDGSAVVAATPVQITLYRHLWYRWLVGGTGNITSANLFVG